MCYLSVSRYLFIVFSRNFQCFMIRFSVLEYYISRNVFVLGDKLPTVYDAAIAIYIILRTPTSHQNHTHLAAQLHTLSDKELSGLPINNLVAERHFSIFSRLADETRHLGAKYVRVRTFGREKRVFHQLFVICF